MARQHERMKRTQHYLPRQQLELLNHLAALTGLTASEHLRRSLDKYLREELKPWQVTRQKTKSSKTTST